MKKRKRHWYWWSPMLAQWFPGKPKYHVSDGLRLRFSKPKRNDPPSYYHRPATPGEEKQMFYIQDSRQFVGNCVLWWGENSSGYTPDIKKAGKFSEEEARKICNGRSTDRAFPCAYIDSLTRGYVDAQDMPAPASSPERESTPQPERGR